jgi:hypothetical protein
LKGEIMKWLVTEIVGPVARRVGGQVAAALVGLGMAQQHESAAAAIVAWAIISAGELLASHRNRNALIDKAKNGWGRN